MRDVLLGAAPVQTFLISERLAGLLGSFWQSPVRTISPMRIDDSVLARMAVPEVLQRLRPSGWALEHLVGLEFLRYRPW
jgi:hypothetical protein